VTAVVEELSRRLADGEVIVIDSAMGTELRARGVPMDDEAWSVVANLSHGHVVQAIHEDHVPRGGCHHRQHLPGRPVAAGAQEFSGIDALPAVREPRLRRCFLRDGRTRASPATPVGCSER
jgi:hypothetical protein